METHIEKLLELIDELVNDTGLNWSEKKAAILKDISDDDLTNLEEFCSWFWNGGE